MKTTKIDQLFKTETDQMIELPKGIQWNKNDGWNNYQKRYGNSKPNNKKLFISSAAAIIIIVIGTTVLLNRTPKLISTRNETTSAKLIKLPDGNSAWLNKNSSIEYPSKINEKNNSINIIGEVYFEITTLENTPINIHAENAILKIETLTSFNIRANSTEENVDITVSSGALKVHEASYQEGLSLLVTEGNYCSVHKSQKLVYSATISNNNYLAWKTGRLTFDNQPMATVKDILAEYYGTDIELANNQLAYCLFSGTFDQQPVQKVLDQIESELNLEIQNNGKSILISGKGCL